MNECGHYIIHRTSLTGTNYSKYESLNRAKRRRLNMSGEYARDGVLRSENVIEKVTSMSQRGYRFVTSSTSDHAALRLTTHRKWEAGLGAPLIGP